MSYRIFVLFLPYAAIEAENLLLMNVVESSNTSINILDLWDMHGVTCGTNTTLYRNSFMDDPSFLQCFINQNGKEMIVDGHGLLDEVKVSISNFINSTVFKGIANYPSGANGYINEYEFQLLYTKPNSIFIFGIYSESGRTTLLSSDVTHAVSVQNASVLQNTTNVKTVSSIQFKAYGVSGSCVMNSTTYKPKNYFPECPTDQSPPVILLPKTQALEKRINSNVTIECQYVSVIKITAIVWNFNSLKTGESKQIPDTSLNGTYSTTEPSLVIKQFGQDDQGLYYCTVSNAKGSSYQMHHINITLLSESPSPIINEHQSAEFGQNLSCKIDVYPAVQNVWWKLNNDVVNYNGSMEAEIYIRTDDLGFYQCCAQNTVGKNCSEGVLVGAKPNVLGITQTNEGFLGKPVNITCDVKSIPQLYNIEWLINDQVIDKIPLHYNIRTKLEEALDSIRTLTYTILTGDTQFPDNKSYTCNATNAFGSKLSPPLFVEIYGVVFYTTPENKVIYGQDITLYCNADSRPNITEVHWHQNNSCIRYNAMKNGITDIHNRVLQIRNTSFDDAGNYTCHIINPKVNKTSNIMQLIVLGGKPNVDSFAIGSEDRNYITVNQSVEVILVCNYTAIPNALSLSWTRTLNGQPKRISPLAKGGTITSPNLTFICDSSVEFDGNYRCTVTNAVGVTDGKTILVKVNESIPMCPCDCEFKKKLLFWKEKNFTKEQMLEYIKPLMEEIEKDMTLDKVKLSQNIRKRTSAPDNRKSAQQIGAVGIAVIVCAFGMIIVFDILAFRECIRTIWGRNSRV